MDDLMTTRQLHELLHVDRITIYRMLGDGRLSGFKVGGQWRFSRAAVEKWLNEQQARPAGSQPPETASSLASPDILPLTCLQTIQDVFAGALGLGAITTATNGVPLTRPSGAARLCGLVLNSEAGRPRCLAAWKAAAGRRPHGPFIAACPAGVSCAWDRVEVQNTPVAVFLAGPFIDTPVEVSADQRRERIAALAELAGLDRALLLEVVAEVLTLDQEKKRRVLDLIERMAAALSEIGEERIKLLDRLRRIAEMTNV